jgi:hypothetical protein
MATRALYVGIGIFALAGFVAAWALHDSGTEPAAERASVKSSVAPTQGPSGSVQPVVLAAHLARDLASTKTDVATEKPHRLASMLLDATDLRKFALEARMNPESGGYYYAMTAANMCSRDMKFVSESAAKTTSQIVEKNSTITTTALALLHSYEAKCSSFASGEAGELWKAVKSQSADGRDPVINVVKAFGTSSDKQKAAKEVFLYGDFGAISSLQLPWQLVSNGRDVSQGIDFNGVRYTGTDQTALSMALSLGACKLGEYCALDDEMQVACVVSGACFSSREDYYRSQFTEATGSKDFEKVLTLARQVQQFIQDGNVAAFAGKRPAG